MRVLFATTANDGHFGPLLPVRPRMRGGRARGAGRRAGVVRRRRASAGLRPRALRRRAAGAHRPRDGTTPDARLREADETVIREVFGRHRRPGGAARRHRRHRGAGAPTSCCASRPSSARWRPPNAAGVPHAQVCHRHARGVRPVRATGSRAAGRAGRAWPGYQTAGRPRRSAEEPVLTSVPRRPRPRRWRRRRRLPTDVRRFRDPGLVDRRRGPAPAVGRSRPCRWSTSPSAPSPGSLPPFAGVFREALDALADQPVRVLMTVGRRVDLDGLGPLPGNARVAPWWHQAGLLPHASAMLGHGGFGTTMGALAAGRAAGRGARSSPPTRSSTARHVAAVGRRRRSSSRARRRRPRRRSADRPPRRPVVREGAHAVAAAIADLPGPRRDGPGLAALAAAPDRRSHS